MLFVDPVKNKFTPQQKGLLSVNQASYQIDVYLGLNLTNSGPYVICVLAVAISWIAKNT